MESDAYSFQTAAGLGTSSWAVERCHFLNSLLEGWRWAIALLDPGNRGSMRISAGAEAFRLYIKPSAEWVRCKTTHRSPLLASCCAYFGVPANLQWSLQHLLAPKVVHWDVRQISRNMKITQIPGGNLAETYPVWQLVSAQELWTSAQIFWEQMQKKNLNRWIPKNGAPKNKMLKSEISTFMGSMTLRFFKAPNFRNTLLF